MGIKDYFEYLNEAELNDYENQVKPLLSILLTSYLNLCTSNGVRSRKIDFVQPSLKEYFPVEHNFESISNGKMHMLNVRDASEETIDFLKGL